MNAGESVFEGHKIKPERENDLRDGGYLRQMPADFPLLHELFADGTFPFEVELGCGKGKFILARAAETPERNFLAVDYARKWMNVGIERGLKRQLGNVRFVHANAVVLVKDYLPDSSVNVFHVYFPDPWPKTRHKKRRLLNSSFFDLLHSKLVPGGAVEIATDQKDYFEQIWEDISASAREWAIVRKSVNERLFCPEIRTNYEIKYAAQGRPLYYVEFVK